MKKVVSILLIAIVIISCVVALTACSPTDKVVGTWKFSSIDFSYGDGLFDVRFDTLCSVTFNKDGTVTNEFNQTAYWRYDKKSKEFLIADKEKDFDNNDFEKAIIDKDGVLHIDSHTYKKAK